MSFLEVPGAQLHYETHGSGPLMIMSPGPGRSRRSQASLYTLLSGQARQPRDTAVRPTKPE